MSRRLPVLALAVLAVGLALHNLVMAELWEAGVRGTALDAAAAWKEVLLASAIVGAFIAAGRHFPAIEVVDALALAYAVIVVLYWLLPQDWLGGEATARGELLALRHHLLPVAAYALGRLLALTVADRRLLAITLGATAVGLALWGLVDVYAVPLQWWRDSGVPGWYGDQLGLTYRGLSGLPENWVLNTGDEENPVRRLVSMLLSPLATSYVLVVVLAAVGYLAMALVRGSRPAPHRRGDQLRVLHVGNGRPCYVAQCDCGWVGTAYDASEPDSRPPPVCFSPPNAPPISAPEVPMLTLAMPQSEPSAARKRSASRTSSVKIADESPCGTALFNAIASSSSS